MLMALRFRKAKAVPLGRKAVTDCRQSPLHEPLLFEFPSLYNSDLRLTIYVSYHDLSSVKAERKTSLNLNACTKKNTA